ncbi:DUF4179 domain-containing protein [Clostridium sp. 'White wine YQ']|uniref:DUF4179 domain-containing protein n=1 Tax=Clostridium sp. 'White wine YQ' TaxID=3027474 RepID=UPI0023664751|nr:DUF4179 domain-containing protein [Clostridium sp. 'White wine YQ']MDD7795154.1 DUF4179 domain-containing protein [Clostridium sp. 'White wine YQ']
MNDIENLKNSITIPKEIDLAIEQGIERGKREKLKNTKPKHNKLIIKIAGLALVFTTAVFIAKPDLVKAISNPGLIFKMLSEKRNYGEPMPKFENFTTSLNKSIEKEGIKLTINEIAIDDSMIAISSTVEGKGVKDKTFDIGGIKLNGMYPQSYGSDSEIISDDKIIVATYSNIAEMNLPDEVQVEISSGIIANVAGPWNFKFTVSKKESKKNSKTIQINKTIDLPESTLNIKNLIISPFGNTINIEGINKTKDVQYKKNNEILMLSEVRKYIVLDDKGNPLMTKEEGGGSNDKGYEEKLGILGDISNLKSITIIPIVEEKGIINKKIDGRDISILQCTINSDDFKNIPQENIVKKRNVTEKEKKDGYAYNEVINSYNMDKSKSFVPIDKLINQKIMVNETTNVEIKNIEANDKGTKITFKINGDYNYFNINLAYIIDENFNTTSRAEDGTIGKIEDVNNKIISIVLPPIDENKKYKIALPLAKNPVIEEKYKINVNLK